VKRLIDVLDQVVWWIADRMDDLADWLLDHLGGCLLMVLGYFAVLAVLGFLIFRFLGLEGLASFAVAALAAFLPGSLLMLR